MVVEATAVALAAVVVERAMVADWAAVLAVGLGEAGRGRRGW